MYTPQHGSGLQQQAYALPTVSHPGVFIQNIYSGVYKYPAATGFQVATVTIGTIAASTNYTLTVNNFTETLNSAALTLANFTTAFVTALRNNSQINALYVVSSAAAGTITLTHRISGMNEVVSIAGGASTISTANSVANDPLPFGRVLVTVPGAVATDDLMPVQLPSAANQNVVGIGGAFEIAEHRLIMPNGSQTYGVAPDNEITALGVGVGTIEAEVYIPAETVLFWRHTANGALDKRGAVAPAAGTGLQGAVAGLILKSKRESFVTPDGRIGVEAYIQVA
jgi:hypothetical protein